MRTTENKKLIQDIPQKIPGTPEQIQLRLLASIVNLLIDISKSQAILADAATASRKAARAKRKEAQK